MTNIHLRDGLLFVEVTIQFGERVLTLSNVVIDTGSETTIFRTDDLEQIGVTLPLDGIIGRVSGIGSGYEWIIETSIDRLTVGELSAAPFTVEMGNLDYGYGINGILGCDFLIATEALIDLKNLELRKA